MSRADRLYDIVQILRDGGTHTAQQLATRTGVSLRTLYRDMDRLAASGVPVEGTRGAGYRIADVVSLPPLSLTPTEVEALNLGLAIAAQLADPELQAAATRLADKIDGALPQSVQRETDAWKFAASPFADAARGFGHLAPLRAAIRARQKLRLTYTAPDGTVTSRTVRPLQVDHIGRVWTLTAWCELRAAFRVFRLDLIESAEALPELFHDEPGRTLADYAP